MMTAPLFLFIDTTYNDCICVAMDEKKVLFSAIDNNKNLKHSVKLFTVLDDCLKTNNLSLNQFSVFAVTNGPGSFTGLRVAIAAVKAFAYAFNKPLIAFDHHLLLAKAALNNILTKNSEFTVITPASATDFFVSHYDNYGRRIEDINLILYPELINYFDKFSDKLFVFYQMPENIKLPAANKIILYSNDLILSAKNIITDKFNNSDFCDVITTKINYFKKTNAEEKKKI